MHTVHQVHKFCSQPEQFRPVHKCAAANLVPGGCSVNFKFDALGSSRHQYSTSVEFVGGSLNQTALLHAVDQRRNGMGGKVETFGNPANSQRSMFPNDQKNEVLRVGDTQRFKQRSVDTSDRVGCRVQGKAKLIFQPNRGRYESSVSINFDQGDVICLHDSVNSITRERVSVKGQISNEPPVVLRLKRMSTPCAHSSN